MNWKMYRWLQGNILNSLFLAFLKNNSFTPWYTH